MNVMALTFQLLSDFSYSTRNFTRNSVENTFSFRFLDEIFKQGVVKNFGVLILLNEGLMYYHKMLTIGKYIFVIYTWRVT